MSEPAVLLDKDLAAKTIEPLVARLFDQLASEAGLDVLQGQLPITVSVKITLRSGHRTLTTATMENKVEALGSVS